MDMKQRQGEKRADYHARIREFQAAERAKFPDPPRKAKRGKRLNTNNRNADIIDGFNRDDLGESFD